MRPTVAMAYLQGCPNSQVLFYICLFFPLSVFPSPLLLSVRLFNWRRTGFYLITSYCAWSRDSHSLTQLPVTHSISFYSPQISTTYWNFLVAYGPLFHRQSQITDCVYVPTSQLDHISLHSALQICTSNTTQFTFPQCQLVSLSLPPVQVRWFSVEPWETNINSFHCIQLCRPVGNLVGWVCGRMKRHQTDILYKYWQEKFLYRVSQKECARLREGVPYVKVYRYNPKHLCPKLNGYGDNGQRSLKL